MLDFPDPTRPGESRGGDPGAADLRHRVDLLEGEINRLLLVVEGLWRLVREHGGLSDDELLRKVYEVDLEDGTLDGRKRRAPVGDCQECGRKLARRLPRCIYCGSIAKMDLF